MGYRLQGIIWGRCFIRPKEETLDTLTVEAGTVSRAVARMIVHFTEIFPEEVLSIGHK